MCWSVEQKTAVVAAVAWCKYGLQYHAGVAQLDHLVVMQGCVGGRWVGAWGVWECLIRCMGVHAN